MSKAITICFTNKKTKEDVYRTVRYDNVRQIAAELERVSTLKMTLAQILGKLENDLNKVNGR